jgi:parallel beta helix pectate lyase-like protein
MSWTSRVNLSGGRPAGCGRAAARSGRPPADRRQGIAFWVALGSILAALAAGSQPTLASSGTPLRLTSRPRLSGTARVGARLEASRGSWTTRPAAYRYRWERCSLTGADCRLIPGATARGHLVTVHDLGSRLRVEVLAIRARRVGRAASRLTSPVTVRPMPSSCHGVAVSTGDDLVAAVAAWPADTTFCLAPGRYAVARSVAPKQGDRLVGQPGTILDAGVPVTGWRPAGPVWAAAAPRSTPTLVYGGGYGGAYEHPQAVYADDLFMDDRPLVKIGVKSRGQVIGSPPSMLRPGEYFYDYDQGLIYLGSDPAGRRVELNSLLPGVIHSFSSDVTIRGLIVQGAFGDGIMDGSGAGWRIVGNELRLNHGAGLRIASGGRVVRNYIHANGTYGIVGSGRSIRISGNEIAENNTALYRRADGGCADAGGSKLTLSTGVVVSSNWYVKNHCIGLWFDISNERVAIIGNHVDANYQNGIDYEISYDGVIRANEVSGSPHWAIVDASSAHVVIAGNTVHSSGAGGIVLNQGPRSDHPSTYGPHQAVNVNVFGNTVVMRSGVSGAQQYGVARTPFAGVVFSSTNRFHDNRYLLRSVRGAWFEWESGRVTIPVWRGYGQDAGSTFAGG